MLAAALAGGLWASGAAAQETATPSLFTVGGGIINLNKGTPEQGYARFEYRHGERYWIIKPTAGFEVALDGSFYAFGGFNIDMFIGRSWVFMPGFAVGGWADGRKIRLGHPLEFRSGAEVAYMFEDGSRLGVAIHHLSNANIGEKNPGTESFMINYSIPLRQLFSR
ncbi:MAG: acyloxyacyl hydrolase [Alphaproteobacteria bacterium]|nr:acyloxyacyl hydrolase [Alphaproteobacteria bacterium]